MSGIVLFDDGEEQSPQRKIRVVYRTGSIFESPPAETLLIHSCNCKGIWGKGIAAEFKQRYPKAFQMHSDFCKPHKPRELLGKSMLLPPVESQVPKGEERHHYIGCLFVKESYGSPKNDVERESIKDATKLAMQQLLEGLVEQRKAGSMYVQEIRMPKINSGIFQVEWEETAAILESMEIPNDLIYASLRTIFVYTG